MRDMLYFFPYDKETTKIIDFGCGTGLVGKALTEIGFKHFTGLDSSDGVLGKCKDSGLYEEILNFYVGRDSLPKHMVE